MLLRVKHKCHTYGGVTYLAGDTFEGTAGLLSRLPDRLVEVIKEKPEADPLDALRADAEGLGIEVDKRWKEKRLREEIDAALDKVGD